MIFCGLWRTETRSGTPWCVTSLQTARHATELGLQGEYIASALLYYPYLLGYVADEELQEHFGETTAKILAALCRLGRFFESNLPWYRRAGPADEDSGRKKTIWTEQTAELMLTAFLSMAASPETAILKCLDRLYLLKSLDRFSLKAEVQRAVANDTLNIHAMVMEALGVWSVKWQLEDTLSSSCAR